MMIPVLFHLLPHPSCISCLFLVVHYLIIIGIIICMSEEEGMVLLLSRNRLFLFPLICCRFFDSLCFSLSSLLSASLSSWGGGWGDKIFLFVFSTTTATTTTTTTKTTGWRDFHSQVWLPSFLSPVVWFSLVINSNSRGKKNDALCSVDRSSTGIKKRNYCLPHEEQMIPSPLISLSSDEENKKEKEVDSMSARNQLPFHVSSFFMSPVVVLGDGHTNHSRLTANDW